MAQEGVLQILVKDHVSLDERVREILAQRRIAVTGISATREPTGNLIDRKLKAAGYQVFAVHPSTPTFDRLAAGDRQQAVGPAGLCGAPQALGGGTHMRQLRRNRRLSKDDEEGAETTEAWIYLDMIRLMLRRLAA